MSHFNFMFSLSLPLSLSSLVLEAFPRYIMAASTLCSDLFTPWLGIWAISSLPTDGSLKYLDFDTVHWDHVHRFS